MKNLGDKVLCHSFRLVPSAVIHTYTQGSRAHIGNSSFTLHSHDYTHHHHIFSSQSLIMTTTKMMMIIIIIPASNEILFIGRERQCPIVNLVHTFSFPFFSWRLEHSAGRQADVDWIWERRVGKKLDKWSWWPRIYLKDIPKSFAQRISCSKNVDCTLATPFCTFRIWYLLEEAKMSCGRSISNKIVLVV